MDEKQDDLEAVPAPGEPRDPETVPTIAYIGMFGQPSEAWMATSQEGARRRLRWAGSPERRMFLRSIAIQGTIWISAAISLTFWINNSQWGRPEYGQTMGDWQWITVMMWMFVIAGAYPMYHVTRNHAASALDDHIRIEQIQKDEADLAKDGRAGTEFAELWSLTQRRIDHYHQLATSQSAVAFRTGQTVMGLGFVVVLALGIAAVMAPNGTAAIAASVIAVSGASLSAFVSATFLKSQSEASAQLREFFVQPVDFTRMLGAERLLEMLDDPAQKAAAVQTLISSLTAGHRSRTQ